MSLGTIVLAVFGTVLAVVITLAIYYWASGDWLWERERKRDRRNWSPPR